MVSYDTLFCRCVWWKARKFCTRSRYGVAYPFPSTFPSFHNYLADVCFIYPFAYSFMIVLIVMYFELYKVVRVKRYSNLSWPHNADCNRLFYSSFQYSQTLVSILPLHLSPSSSTIPSHPLLFRQILCFTFSFELPKIENKNEGQLGARLSMSVMLWDKTLLGLQIIRNCSLRHWQQSLSFVKYAQVWEFLVIHKTSAVWMYLLFYEFKYLALLYCKFLVIFRWLWEVS